MPTIFSPFLEKQKFILLDGALATELERKGADLNHPLWSAKILAEAPDLIRQTHLEYLEAGADIITTASYQASFPGFKKFGFSEKEAATLFEQSVLLAEEARCIFLEKNEADTPPLIAASLGPYGAFLADGSEYRGNYDVGEKSLFQFHEKRLRIFENLGTDLLLFETIPSRREALAILNLLEKSDSGIPALISFTCKNERQISDGHPFPKVVQAVEKSERVAAVGINCTSPKFFGKLIRSARSNTSKLILAYPNAGENWNATLKNWETPEGKMDTFSESERWLAEGANIIGGCCRTTPQQIKGLNKIKMRETLTS